MHREVNSVFASKMPLITSHFFSYYCKLTRRNQGKMGKQVIKEKNRG